MKKKSLIYLIIFSLIFMLVGCNKEEKVITKENYLLDTLIQLKAYGKNSEKATNEAMDAISDIDDIMSPTKPTSDVVKINNNAGKDFVKINENTLEVIKTSIKYSKLSKGNFDITVGPLVKLWGIGTENARVPSKEEIDTTLKLINYENVLIDEKNKSIKLKSPKEAIDLGGIAKGFAGDKAREILENKGIKSAYLNLGGNIVTIGNKTDGTPWNIGIQDPLSDRGEYFGIVRVSNKSVVSSGNYERFFIKDNKRYHHILNTKTGYPSESGILSSTIISDKSIDGDALSTITFILGLEKSMEIIENIDGVDAIFVTTDKKVHTTSNIAKDFKLSSKEYIYEKR
ncbi:FAD:protein FMN transferase [Clostridium tetani]|uniref:FAD:protein FMN transferase n=1 Tax=Clostridium tetani (strain Massachusetts / E88) TaxID=212717 RepID=Q896H7_CLOTE|nr:FAD:protein FMN transferase [Clostridium tetani]AAO35613.1 thiamine biosynthesis lipoprotein apbE precursor [Clostridium tetani E88]KGI36988.1 thiamine biosynthesis protein ApbE [Clostridium tetani]KGI46333.1 thiamine biosynthesis protein ApbE [Clostridium tetani]KHO36444.1 thiamine biosynthesis protein ApbE [Clostridium tetani]KIG21057.1 thiamine biosynthesis protein ApbE [Clostridium tetani]